jgi:peptide/nickel transport system permease protein
VHFFLIRRVLAAVPVILVVTVFVFALLHLAPGDPAAIIAGDLATAEDIAKIRSKLGLDQPLLVQFFTWTNQLLHGDLGNSIFSAHPVSQLIAQRLEPTVTLTVMTLLISILIAVPLGVIAAWRVGSWIDRGVMGFAVFGFSVPGFVIGYVLIWLFAIRLDWLPVQGYTPLAKGFGPWLANIVLPSVTLALAYMALIARITRAAMLETLSQDYIRTAHAKGLATPAVLLRHALHNASVPIVTVIGIGVALLIGGVVITESVFAIPGLGRLTVDAILRRDYPVIQGIILVFSGAYVLVNLIVDMLYTVLDPRIRY